MHTLPHVEHAGDVFYTVGIIMGLILWGFAIFWFVVAVITMAISGGFLFNMVPVGKLPPPVSLFSDSLPRLMMFATRSFHAPDDHHRKRVAVKIL